MRKINLRILLNTLSAEVLAGADALHSGEPLILSGVSIDSREDQRGKLFFALRGERADGHDYVMDALLQGALAAVVDARAFADHPARARILEYAGRHTRIIIAACDARRALGDMAAIALAAWRVPVIAVTGSSGKTTTRNILYTLLSARFAVRNAAKNYNNDIGVPLTIFSLEDNDEMLLLEMGMNHVGELSRLAEIARPVLVIITNIGTAHIENFGSREAIARAKKEALSYFDANCAAVLNRDDPYFDFLRAEVPGTIIPFGAIPEGFTVARDRGLDGYMLGCAGGEVSFALGGAHNLMNLSAAAAAADKLGLAKSVIAGRISYIRAVESRSQVVGGRVAIINDCYNANPESMRAGLTLLASVRGSRRIAVLADMLELGGDSARIHGELGAWISGEEVCDEFVAIGPAMAGCASEARARGFCAERLHIFPSCGEAKSWLPGFVRAGDTVFLKGSHAMRLEEMLPLLES
ncbi:MAG: UDP-N-acetylmuramoyl-tripeptide--D-alanyl-D-alanine ligase [Spirochaetota bacterium]|jgi:UDP-N-acetylmuramoyl-tripeptide--D-alanyl-D-alanine ligase|nr:UDP-N-acetylmuramoyl-tripeptide--D-alanyl-D-alanine ligase [Spirochaetota bacterium]